MAAWALFRLVDPVDHYRATELIAFTPYVALAAPLTVVAALVLRRFAAAAIALVATVALASAVLPRELGASATVGDDDRTLTVMTLNMSDGEADAAAVVDLVRREGVDVLSLQETSSEGHPNLRSEGLRRLLPVLALGIDSTALYAVEGARPLSEPASPAAEPGVPGMRIAHGPEAVEIWGPHPPPPTMPVKHERWRVALGEVPEPRGDGRVRVIAGDLNATLDHDELREVLAAGYVDAADAVGAGLTGTYPASGWLPPPIAVDHVLVDERAAVVAHSTHEVPGSDHRAVVAELVVRGR